MLALKLNDEGAKRMVRKRIKDFLEEFFADSAKFEDKDFIERTNLCAVFFAEFDNLEREKRHELLRWVARAIKNVDCYQHVIKVLCRDYADVLAVNEIYLRAF